MGKLSTVLRELEFIGNTRSRKLKEEILRNLVNVQPELTKAILEYAYNPFWMYNITVDKKILPEGNYDVDWSENREWVKCKKTLDLLKSGEVNGNSDKGWKMVRDTLSTISKASGTWFIRILNKDLRIGISDKTINKVIPNLIPENNPMLCKVLDVTNPEDVAKVNGWLLEPKYDGLRAIAIKENGVVSFATRSGKQLWNTEVIANQLKSLSIDNIVFDGELLADNWNDTIKITNKQSNHPDKYKLMYYVFDCMSLDKWLQRKSERLMLRKSALKLVFNKRRLANVELVPYITACSEVLEEQVQIEVKNGFEGAVLKDPLSRYKWGRSDSWLKAKPVWEADLSVVKLEEGTGKNAGRLGAVIAVGTATYKGKEYKVRTKVGSGFSDEQRKKFYKPNSKLYHATIQVEFQEIAFKEKQGEYYALRFPVFKRVRTDK